MNLHMTSLAAMKRVPLIEMLGVASVIISYGPTTGMLDLTHFPDASSGLCTKSRSCKHVTVASATTRPCDRSGGHFGNRLKLVSLAQVGARVSQRVPIPARLPKVELGFSET
jgi:hypothetical protein